MTTNAPTSLATTLTFLALLTACGNTTGSVIDETPDVDDGEITSVEDLNAYLTSEGHTVATSGEQSSQPFFTAPGTILTIDGQTVIAFEYPTRQAAEDDADTISIDGSTIANNDVDWIDEPHFYLSGPLLVLYVGNDEETLDTLEDALGAQIAGGPTDDEDDLIPDGESSAGMSARTGTGMGL